MRSLTLKFVATIVAAFMISTPAALAQDSRPFSASDMWSVDRISSPVASPDGSRLALVRKVIDMEANKGRTDIWMVNADGSDMIRLTAHEATDVSPVWSPDGKDLFFLSSRSGSMQVWRIPVDGGESRQVTDLPLDVGSMALSPDGTTLAVSMEVFVDCESLECTVERLAQEDKRKDTGVGYDGLLFRHWDAWEDGRRSHLFAVAVDGSSDPVDVTAGMDADVPSKPFGGAEEYTFTPDGKGLVFSARDVGAEEAWSTNFDLYSVPIDGSRSPLNLTRENEAWDTQPSFSPDGKSLAYLAMARPRFEADQLRVVMRSWDARRMTAGAANVVAPDWDRSTGSIAWSPDSRTVYAVANNLGHRSLFALSTGDGSVRTVLKEGWVNAVTVARKANNHRLIVALDHLKSPTELYNLRPNGSGMEKITAVNDEKLAAVRMGDFEQFTFKGANEETVYAYVVKPVDFEPTKKYPVAFLIHGGPQGSFGNHFHYRWNPQAYAGAGYAAIMVDFHGSTGYGQDFIDSIRDDWGGKPLEDLQKGLAAALDRYKWLDGDRVAALGASYGGYMINWIAGNWPDRFRCLVNHDGVFDLRAAFFSTEELWFPEWEFKGTPWSNPAGYDRHNPIDHVGKWKTPTLVIHGGLDYRVPETHSFGAFTALQRQGVPSRFLFFPDENHWVLQPHNGLQWHEEVLGWLDRWTKSPGGSASK